MKSHKFRTTLHSFPRADSVPAKVSAPMSEDKKQARIVASLNHRSNSIGFLHAVLLQIGGVGIVLCGPSGSGKTTLASLLVEQGATIVANDWIAVEVEGGKFFASDLNYAEELRQSKRVELRAILFLTRKDNLRRDAYIPDRYEFKKIVTSCFDGMNSYRANKLAAFWTTPSSKIPFYCVIPTRQRSVEAVATTISSVLRRIRPSDDLREVGIIGVGAVGSALAAQLGQATTVHKVHLYNRNKKTAVGLAMDLNQALYKGQHDIFVAQDTIEDVFRQSSSVFISFRENIAPPGTKSLPERWKKVYPHSKYVREYAKIASSVSFTGNIFIITNPVDYLTFAFYDATQKTEHPLRSFQVYGIGLESDLARTLFYGRQIEPRLTTKHIQLYGNHADTICLHTNLPKHFSENLAESVLSASTEVRSHDIRTVYGPVAAAMKGFNAVERGGQTSITCVMDDNYIGRRLTFRYGIPLLADQPQSDDYSKLLRQNRLRIAKYSKLQ